MNTISENSDEKMQARKTDEAGTLKLHVKPECGVKSIRSVPDLQETERDPGRERELQRLCAFASTKD